MSPSKFWTPVRSGEIYCSPSCGGKCTWTAYKRAHKESLALAKRMGPHWRPDVWENLGWHYQVIDASGMWKISQHNDHFTAYLGEPDRPGGRWAKSAETPEASIAAVRRVAINDLCEIAELLGIPSRIAAGKLGLISPPARRKS